MPSSSEGVCWKFMPWQVILTLYLSLVAVLFVQATYQPYSNRVSHSTGEATLLA